MDAHLVQQLDDLLGALDDELGDILHVDAQVGVLPDGELLV